MDTPQTDQGPTVAEQLGGAPDDAINLVDRDSPMTVEALHAAIQARSNEPVKEYVPPPRTPRQMTALEEELEAGRKRVEFNEAQKAHRPQLTPDDIKQEMKVNGNVPTISTPVMRPADGAGTEDRNKATAFQPGGPKNKG